MGRSFESVRMGAKEVLAMAEGKQSAEEGGRIYLWPEASVDGVFTYYSYNFNHRRNNGP
jgi:hypothetical protein